MRQAFAEIKAWNLIGGLTSDTCRQNLK